MKLLLVQGCPRSGTTLINRLLNKHPKIAITNELDLVTLSEKTAAIVFNKNINFNKNKIHRVKSSKEDWNLSEFSQYMPKDEKIIVEIMKICCSSIKQSDDLDYYGDKTPTYYLYDPKRLKQLSLDGRLKIIHVTRNPDDVIDSIMNRTSNSLRGKDTWRSIVTKRDAMTQWKLAWNSRKLFRDDLDLDFLDLNFNKFLENIPEGTEVLANFLDVDNEFDAQIVLKDNKRKEKKILQSIKLKDNSSWDDYPLTLDNFNELLIHTNDSPLNKVTRIVRKYIISKQRSRLNG